MSIQRLLNMRADVYRPTFAKSATSAAKTATWSMICTVNVSLQGMTSKSGNDLGATRMDWEYTLFAENATIRPSDRLDVYQFEDGRKIPGTVGASSSAPFTHEVTGGPEDKSGRGKFYTYTVKRNTALSANS